MKLLLVLVALAALTVSGTAHAYIGPGAGLGAIGTLIAFFGAILLAIVGFVWYPIKRLLGLGKRKRAKDQSQAREQQEDTPTQSKKDEGETYSP